MSGITSYRGFLYQQEIFYDRLLKNLYNGDYEIGFEICDDVNVEYKIASLKYKDYLIQVKSGDLSKEDFYKIFENWILETDFVNLENFTYELISEKKVDIERDDKFLKDLKDHILNAKDSDIRSIKRQCCDKIIKNNYDEAELYTLLKQINEKCIITDNLDIEWVKQDQFKIFNEKCCADIYSDLTIPRKERFDFLKQKIIKELIDSVESKCGYKLASGTFQKYIIEGSQKFGNETFEPDFMEFKKSKNIETTIKEIYQDNKLEVKQLKLAERSNQQIYEDILRELFYRKLIDYYEERDINKILITHEEAKDNFFSAIDELELIGKEKTPKNVYIATTNKEIKSEIISNSRSCSFLQKGCYVHMTSDQVDESVRIKWGEISE